MTVENSYHKTCGDIWRVRKCMFPEGHHMKTTYGLDSTVIHRAAKGNTHCITAKGNVLGQPLEVCNGILYTNRFKELLKSLKSVTKMSLNETVKDLLRVGKYVR